MIWHTAEKAPNMIPAIGQTIQVNLQSPLIKLQRRYPAVTIGHTTEATAPTSLLPYFIYDKGRSWYKMEISSYEMAKKVNNCK